MILNTRILTGFKEKWASEEIKLTDIRRTLGRLQFMGLRRAGHDLATDNNNTNIFNA